MAYVTVVGGVRLEGITLHSRQVPGWWSMYGPGGITCTWERTRGGGGVRYLERVTVEQVVTEMCVTKCNSLELPVHTCTCTCKYFFRRMDNLNVRKLITNYSIS